MNICGIIIAKKNSIRFPGKNEKLFSHSIELLKKSNYIEKIYVSTDSEKIKKYCKKENIEIIDRGINIISDEQSFFEVLKYTYQCLKSRYDIIVSVLANSINHTAGAIDKAIEKMILDNSINEIRSFDNEGIENGILIFKEKVLIEQHEISSHLYAIESEGKEIHYKGELDE